MKAPSFCIHLVRFQALAYVRKVGSKLRLHLQGLYASSMFVRWFASARLCLRGGF